MATIELTQDGPLVVKGVAKLGNSHGEAIAAPDPFYLCRCGNSANKPFCDGSHQGTGFKADGFAASDSAAASAVGAASPGVQVLKDGPYMVTGVPDLQSLVAPADPVKYALCRCGLSKSKPFCDGAHRAAGFKDERN